MLATAAMRRACTRTLCASPRVMRPTSQPTLSFDPSAKTAMDKQEPPAPGADFRVVIVGAGNINFGSDEGPWNHSFRLEHKLGPRLKVVALIDPDAERARRVLKTKCQSFVLSAYKDTVVYPTFKEKPVSTGAVDQTFEVAKMLERNGSLVSVGYMLRYLKVVQKMKQIIAENDLHVMAVNARYIMAYEHTAKLDWWDKSKNPGPIVEQATHFCDLARYFAGEVDLSSVMAQSLEHYEPAGQLRKIPVDESLIEPANRIPRVTCATWKFESGAVGSLTHAVALQGTDYSTQIDVYADGYSLRLVDPYNAPMLYIRRPGDDHEEIVRYNDDDPFFSEVSSLIDCIEHGEGTSPILSSYEDAARTYALTWAIREASERTMRPRP